VLKDEISDEKGAMLRKSIVNLDALVTCESYSETGIGDVATTASNSVAPRAFRKTLKVLKSL